MLALTSLKTATLVVDTIFYPAQPLKTISKSPDRQYLSLIPSSSTISLDLALHKQPQLQDTVLVTPL